MIWSSKINGGLIALSDIAIRRRDIVLLVNNDLWLVIIVDVVPLL